MSYATKSLDPGLQYSISLRIKHRSLFLKVAIMKRRWIASIAFVFSSRIIVVKCLREEATSKPTPSWVDDKNATLLDVFGEVAKDILINRMIPDTEASCDWHWMHLRCEPYCSCSLQPLWGDYHLGRSCRSRVIIEEGNVNYERKGDGVDTSDIIEKDDGKIPNCDLPPDTIAYKGMNGVVQGVKFTWKKINLRRRVENAKYKACDSFFKIEIHESSNNETDDDGGILEKPVRALRKSLNCNARRADDMDQNQTPNIEFITEGEGNTEQLKFES